MSEDYEYRQEQMRFNKISARAAAWSAFAGVAGVFLGLIGLGIALYSLKVTLQLERLRIRPAIEFHFGDTNSQTLLSIDNDGFGPAVIQSMEFVYGEKRYEAVDRPVGEDFASKVIWILGMNNLALSAPESEKFSVRMPFRGTTVSAGSRTDLINYRGYESGYYKIRPSVMRSLQDFFQGGGNIVLKYCSLDGVYCTSAEAKN